MKNFLSLPIECKFRLEKNKDGRYECAIFNEDHEIGVVGDTPHKALERLTKHLNDTFSQSSKPIPSCD